MNARRNARDAPGRAGRGREVESPMPKAADGATGEHEIMAALLATNRVPPGAAWVTAIMENERKRRELR